MNNLTSWKQSDIDYIINSKFIVYYYRHLQQQLPYTPQNRLTCCKNGDILIVLYILNNITCNANFMLIIQHKQNDLSIYIYTIERCYGKSCRVIKKPLQIRPLYPILQICRLQPNLSISRYSSQSLATLCYSEYLDFFKEWCSFCLSLSLSLIFITLQ